MDKIKQALTQPLVAGPVPPKTFRLGIVLNGTVAAGAWTAGALDALIEVLDRWEAAKVAGQDVARHSLRVEVLGGASGGGVCAAIFARAASRVFPHVRDSEGHAANPFWQVWVEALDLLPMLGDTDLAAAPDAVPASVLSGKAIEQAIAAILGWGIDMPGVTPREKPRAWLADPFHVGMTITNLRGVPIGIEFRSSIPGVAGRKSQFVNHADHAWFAIGLGGAAALGALRGDQVPVAPDFVGHAKAWSELALYARATAAFPVGFPPVKLVRKKAIYDWRAVLLPSAPDEQGNRKPFNAEEDVKLLRPYWECLRKEERDLPDYAFHAVDGGATNNQPVELVRAGLMGLGRNLQRDTARADAAILVMDPFAAMEQPRDSDGLNMFGVAGELLGTWKAQARFGTADLMLALDDDVGSRFLLTAGRTNAAGEKVFGTAALATSGVGAFLGFASRRYRIHDYLLGRRNMLGWLEKHFVVPNNNRVVGDPEAARGDKTLPIIPLVGVAPAAEDPPWPILDPDADLPLDALGERTRGVGATILPGWLKWTSRPLWWWKGDKLTDALRQAIIATNRRE